MPSLELVRSLIDYHLALTRRVWEVIERITEEQYLADDAYSRGSIRNLMVHLASTDRRWLSGLKEQPDVGHLQPEEYPTRAAGRALFENVARELADYAAALTEAGLEQNARDIPSPRWQVLVHMVNHGTDHRATVLQKLTALGAPSFGQDYIFWAWESQKKNGNP